MVSSKRARIPVQFLVHIPMFPSQDMSWCVSTFVWHRIWDNPCKQVYEPNRRQYCGCHLCCRWQECQWLLELLRRASSCPWSHDSRSWAVAEKQKPQHGMNAQGQRRQWRLVNLRWLSKGKKIMSAYMLISINDNLLEMNDFTHLADTHFLCFLWKDPLWIN